MALKEANRATSEPDAVELDKVKISLPSSEPRRQNAQQIVFELLKLAAKHRKQLELALFNQKKEIKSCTIPFLQELIEGEDGGT